MAERINDFLQVAMDDGIVTQEEISLITVILSSVDKYNKLLSLALADGVITQKERNQLFKERLHIVESGYFHAMHDKVITEDERKLLHTMRLLLDKFRENEQAATLDK